MISEKHVSSPSTSDAITIDLPSSPPTTTIPPSDSFDTPLAPLNELEDSTNLPQNLTLFQIFTLFFLRFGIHAWGGSVAQIALLKTELVQKRRWITIARFNRVYAVYQMLPGPEAAEICMFFGCLVGGRWGGIVAGLGFILPGFMAMVLLSYFYTIAGLDNVYFNASFRALQPVVAAMVLRAVFQIGQHAFISSTTKTFNKVLFILAILGALQSALRINYFITLGVFGIFYNFYTRGWRWAAGAVMLLNYVGYILYVIFKGVPSPTSLALGIATVPDMPHLLALGLVAGSLSFGGAYTSIPFIQAEAVILGGWLANQTFLDGIALGNIIPAPLVIFSTFVGFQGGHTYGEGSLGYAFGGCVLITLGMFLPCFIFTIMGHSLLERVCRNETMASFFDGITGSVVGIIAITALDILKASVVHLPKPGVVLDGEEWLLLAAQNTLSAVIFVMTFTVFRHQYLSVLLVVVAALAGQFLFV
ncbi:MAG: LOW QUALITY PROTEIN: chromate transporter-domain-containing protein [Linnemannia elongata]|nr:MAG: LOW QUALITY PROTEIN: chromate transporter-domain-containing protein [Linnemannia elongata]